MPRLRGGSHIIVHRRADYDRDRWRARWGVGPQDLLLSYFGFLNESKGAEALVRALDRLVRGGYKARLLMVGGKVGSSDPTNAVYLGTVEGLIEELGLADRVLWTGYTSPEEASANLLASDICVLPYRYGASSRRGSFMGTLAHGLPIVSSRPRVDEPELRHGENIRFVPPESLSGLGVREGGYVYLFAQAGVPAPLALTMSLAFCALNVATSCIGGILHAPEGARSILPTRKKL